MNHPVSYSIKHNVYILLKNNQNSGMGHICDEAENAVFAMRLVKGNFSMFPG